ncbi:unnamed protein product [Schistosoma curassoni]|uniref:Pectate lyase n=1 Tax=Schistosoma curassoni TaxID=6186 RepID=A0A183JXR5_9TREM|nr:unnamed protein product [Schistosoma curassoni]
MKLQHYFVRRDSVGKSMVQIQDINDFTTRSACDCIQYQDLSGSVLVSGGNSGANGYILNHTNSISITQPDRHMMNLRRRVTMDRRNLDSYLSCGGCDVCMK